MGQRALRRTFAVGSGTCTACECGSGVRWRSSKYSIWVGVGIPADAVDGPLMVDGEGIR
jgi:hypothetical protein